MAVASSSRQKSSGRSSRRRDPSSDGIEDAQVSQRRIASDDELEDEEEEQPRRSAKGKKGKPTREIGSEAEDDGDEDDELEDDGRIDVNNFKDQPLIKTEAGKIKGVASDWANIRTQSQNTVKGLMDNVGTSLADLMPPDEAEKVSSWRESNGASAHPPFSIGSQRTGHLYEGDSRYRRGNASS